ncbi:MAG: hypothetical protein QM723_34380 [Myxococcaceae bacterium]
MSGTKANSTSFKPGQVANPGGRPKGIKELRAKCREVTQEVVEFWVATMNNLKAKGADRLRASENIMAYGWGRPLQKIEVDDERPQSTNARDLLIARLEALSKAAPAEAEEQHEDAANNENTGSEH